METQILSELELNVLKDLKIQLPHRRAVLEVGEKFGDRETIIEKLKLFGEVHLEDGKRGELYEKQLELFGFFQHTTLYGIIAPKDPDLYGQLFNLDKDHHITITLLDHEKAVGIVQLSMLKNLPDMVSDYNELDERNNWTEQQRTQIHQFHGNSAQFIRTSTMKFSFVENLVFYRTLIVHPEHRGKGLGTHLKLMQLIVGWLLSTECCEMTYSVGNVGLNEKLGAEFVAATDMTEYLKLIPEQRRPEFTQTLRMYLYRYRERSKYYHNCIATLKRH